VGSRDIWWLGSSALGHAAASALGVPLRTVPPCSDDHDTAPPVAVIDATALDPRADVASACAYVESMLASPEPPERVVHIVPLAWLGRGSPGDAGRAAYVVAHARASALRAAPTTTTVNTITVPAGFPDAAPTLSAPVKVAAGIAELGHALAFFLDPDNTYVVGQTLSICGGDDAWGNHSL
jgi:hypothetical protein